MYVLRSLGKLLLGDQEEGGQSLAIEGGELISPDTKEIIDNDCNLTLIKRKKFTCELCVSEFDIPVKPTLNFTFDEDDKVFEWSDEEGHHYRFVIPPGTSPTTIEMFQFGVAQAIYEHQTQRSRDTARDEDLQLWMKTKKRQLLQGSVVFESQEAEFFHYDPILCSFVPHCDVKVTAVITDAFKLYVLVREKIIHSQEINPDATQHTDRPTFSFIWCHLEEDQVKTYSLKFADAVALLAFANAYGQTVYEILNEEKIGKRLNEAEQKYVLNPFLDDVEMLSDSESEEGVMEVVAEGAPIQTDSGGTNSQLVVGYSSDSSFVSRGSALGVFKHQGDTLVLRANLDCIQDPLTKKPFAPSRMQLHDQDTQMLMQKADDLHHLYKMDLERGKVVEEWTISKDAPLKGFLPDSKYAQMTSNQTLIGFNARSLFRIDPRLPGEKIVSQESKTYATKNDFSCGATTGAGELALASTKGEIRLFDKLDKRAKTLLPMFGDPITGIDVTESGRYIIATCKNYLLFICTEHVDDPNRTGFTKSLGQDKPIPRRLQLKPEHVALMGQSINFTPARFSTGAAEERAIITSTGPFVITWNLRRVKLGHLWDYQIKRYEDQVVADSFRYGADRSIVVTLPHHVTMLSKSSLQSPSPRLLRRTNF